MTIIFFFKYLKSDVDSTNGTKKSEKVVSFEDNCICIGDDKFTQSGTGYLSLADHVIRNTPTF